MPAGDPCLAAELEDARESLVQVLFISVAVPCHIFPQLHTHNTNRSVSPSPAMMSSYQQSPS